MEELQFGETPFDHMTHDELLRTCQRMYAALYDAKNALENIRRNEPHNTYLTDPRAVGGSAIERSRQILEPIWIKWGRGKIGWGQEAIHVNFYAYAMGLLFHKTQNGISMGLDWTVCLNPKCGTWAGVNRWNPEPPTTCPMCNGDIRPLNWDDLKPNPKELKTPPNP